MCLTHLVSKIRSIMAQINPKDFLLNTDYELDKIIFVKTGDFVSSTEFSYNLNFTPLIFGIWSTSSDFSSANILGPQITAEPIPGLYTPPLTVGCRALPDKIKLTAIGEGADSTRIYYRLYGFAHPNSNSNVPTTSNLAHSFSLNTDYNYRKLKEAGEFTSGGQTYQHNLGYLPQVMAWFQYKEVGLSDYDYGIEPITDASPTNGYQLEVTTTYIKVPSNFPFSLIDKVMWRVYYDEA